MSNEEAGKDDLLEHALLESLFYQEMMMDNTTSLSSDFMAYLSSNAQNSQGAPDASAIAEKAMLRDFGVTSAPSTVASHIVEQTVNPAAAQQQGLAGPRLVAKHPNNLVPSPPPHVGMVHEQAGVADQTQHQLVSQFATLARRLGIPLTPDILSALSSQGQSGEENVGLQALSGLIKSETGLEERDSFEGDDDDDDQDADSGEDTRKRYRTEGSSGSRASTQSKRRKKPNLTECESKLTSLKVENEMLKRHLDVISHRSQKFDQERKKQEDEMKRLMEQDPTAEKLDPLLKEYAEMYSDYGRHRHQELTFHLEQVQRLVAPTDFTKLGLFALGRNEKNKRNPIAGILSEELEITPNQGRKILEQRQKIRDLTDNLKECLRLLGKLKSICEHKQKVFSDRMSKCQEILTPLQVAKLLLWVDEHADVLESTCPGWGSERIHGSAKKESA